jgi:hypothetical protein
LLKVGFRLLRTLRETKQVVRLIAVRFGFHVLVTLGALRHD